MTTEEKLIDAGCTPDEAELIAAVLEVSEAVLRRVTRPLEPQVRPTPL